MAAPINDLSVLSAPQAPCKAPSPKPDPGSPNVSFGAALKKATGKASGHPKPAAAAEPPSEPATLEAPEAPAEAKAGAASGKGTKEAVAKTGAAKNAAKQRPVQSREKSSDEEDDALHGQGAHREVRVDDQATSLDHPADAGNKASAKDPEPASKSPEKAAAERGPTVATQPAPLADAHVSLQSPTTGTTKSATKEPAEPVSAEPQPCEHPTKPIASSPPQTAERATDAKPAKTAKSPKPGHGQASTEHNPESGEADADADAESEHVHPDAAAAKVSDATSSAGKTGKAKPEKAAAPGHPLGAEAPESAKPASGHRAHTAGETAQANAAASTATNANAPATSSDAPADTGTSRDASVASVTGTHTAKLTLDAAGTGLATVDPTASQPAPAPAAHVAAAASQPPPAPPEVRFADVNHPKIVSGVHGQLLPGGGTMQIRLDPAELGPLQVTVKMRNGVMTASFETSNDQATQALSHSLAQLKTALETGGVTVEKLHVQQSAKPAEPAQQQGGGNHDARGEQSAGREQEQERQRKELLRRMWQRLSVGSDPLDMVA